MVFLISCHLKQKPRIYLKAQKDVQDPKYKTTLDANTKANMYKYKIQNSRYADGRWMTPMWGRNSFVGITKDFLMTMKTCKSGNSTKMFCPQMEDIRPRIMLYFENTLNLYSWVFDMLACPFVHTCGCSSKMVKSFIWFAKQELAPKAATLAAIELCTRNVSICYLGQCIWDGVWYLGWWMVYLSNTVKSFYWICKAGEAGWAAIEFWWQSNNNFFLVHLNFPSAIWSKKRHQIWR